MHVHIIDGHTVNSSFDYENTESMLRSFLAIAQASMIPEFEGMSEPEQERMVQSYYEKPIPEPSKEATAIDPDKIGPDLDNPFKQPFVLEMDNGEKVVIHSSSGQWFVLLETEMLSFRPIG